MRNPREVGVRKKKSEVGKEGEQTKRNVSLCWPQSVSWQVISQFLMTGHITSPYSPSERVRGRNLSPASSLNSQIPSLQDINSPTLLCTACVDAQVGTLASHTSGARGNIAVPLQTRQVCGYVCAIGRQTNLRIYVFSTCFEGLPSVWK